MQGDFGIDAGSFTKSDTQQGVNSLSHGALGEKNQKTNDDDSDPRNVLSDLKGHVLLKNGIATFSNLSFGVPGALAQMRGTYDLISEKIDLHGTLKTEAEVSKTTHGIKSLMLKVLDPFFKNKPDGYLAPVKITGTYDHPEFGLDLGDRTSNKNQNAKAHAQTSSRPVKAVIIRHQKGHAGYLQARNHIKHSPMNRLSRILVMLLSLFACTRESARFADREFSVA